MIKRLAFENFRGIKKMELSDMKPITLVSGKNNAGKSSILEGIFLLFDHFAPDSFVKLNHFRGLPLITDPSALWNSLFYNMDTTQTIGISVETEDSVINLKYARDEAFAPNFVVGNGMAAEELNQFISSAKKAFALEFNFCKGQYKECGHFVAAPNGIMRNLEENNQQIEEMPYIHFINSLTSVNDTSVVEWFSKSELEGKKKQVVDILRIIEPEISDITTIAMNNQIQLYTRIREKMFPLKVAGDGLNKLLFIILAIMENPDAVILIDEIETGFHYSIYTKLWESIAKVAKENHCQVIASTHSYECIVSAVEGMEKAGLTEDFCYFRIQRNEAKNNAYCYSNDLLRLAIESEMEVR